MEELNLSLETINVLRLSSPEKSRPRLLFERHLDLRFKNRINPWLLLKSLNEVSNPADRVAPGAQLHLLIELCSWHS